jgi:hypothetical protein
MQLTPVLQASFAFRTGFQVSLYEQGEPENRRAKLGLPRDTKPFGARFLGVKK